MQWVQRQQTQHPDLPPFKMGFHGVPSLLQLHMHVISQASRSAVFIVLASVQLAAALIANPLHASLVIGLQQASIGLQSCAESDSTVIVVVRVLVI